MGEKSNSANFEAASVVFFCCLIYSLARLSGWDSGWSFIIALVCYYSESWELTVLRVYGKVLD